MRSRRVPFTSKTIRTNGISMAVRDEGQGPAVVLCHGFPELAYSWRHQVPALAAAGFRAIAPDQRGYGDTERPADVAAYDIHQLTGDLVGLLDALGIERAVFAGHDWGGLVVWQMPLLHPERTAGIIGVNTPYFPRAFAAPTAIFRQLFGDNYYICHFQQPGVADAALARDPRRVFTQLMRRGVPISEAEARLAARGAMPNMVEMVFEGEPLGAPLLADDELAVYAETFTRTGFTGGINWYRNLDRNWETTPELANAPIAVPSLMVTAEWDAVLRPEMAEPMRAFVSDLEIHMIRECGHWTPQERPRELNAAMIDWPAAASERRMSGGGVDEEVPTARSSSFPTSRRRCASGWTGSAPSACVSSRGLRRRASRSEHRARRPRGHYGAMGGTLGGGAVGLDVRIVVADVDAVHRRARDAGVEIVHDIADRDYGLRDFIVRDLNGTASASRRRSPRRDEQKPPPPAALPVPRRPAAQAGCPWPIRRRGPSRRRPRPPSSPRTSAARRSSCCVARRRVAAGRPRP
jgi:pimeloyl-ACP methyl ester carboxylesterase